jgi:hypothetical protein
MKRAERAGQNSRETGSEIAKLRPAVIARSESDEAIHSYLARRSMDCFASLAMTVSTQLFSRCLKCEALAHRGCHHPRKRMISKPGPFGSIADAGGILDRPLCAGDDGRLRGL